MGSLPPVVVCAGEGWESADRGLRVGLPQTDVDIVYIVLDEGNGKKVSKQKRAAPAGAALQPTVAFRFLGGLGGWRMELVYIPPWLDGGTIPLILRYVTRFP